MSPGTRPGVLQSTGRGNSHRARVRRSRPIVRLDATAYFSQSVMHKLNGNSSYKMLREFTYSLAWGINNRSLNSENYLNVAIKSWNAIANTALHDDGFLGYVQSGKQPSKGQPLTTYDKKPDVEDSGLGCFLLADS